MKKQILSLLLAALLVCMVSLSVLAASSMPESGSITIKVKYNGKPLDGGELTLYKVGKIVEEDGNYRFELVRKLKNSGISLKDVDDPQLAEELAELAEKKEQEGISAHIAEGAAVFEGLDTGLYVVVQTEKCPGFAAMNPYLIAVPQYEDGEWNADVVARPKVPVEEEPGTPPDTPDEPDTPDQPDEPDKPVEPDEPNEPTLPETGQLNWPVPLLAVSGLTMILLGWWLCFRRKKDGYEK